jgi:hypothetical protein
MKIGNHIGRRATFDDEKGYFFETINDDGSNLFVFDEKIGHNAPPYFNKHKDEWNDELKQRCWYVSKVEVTFNKKKVVL